MVLFQFKSNFLCVNLFLLPYGFVMCRQYTRMNIQSSVNKLSILQYQKVIVDILLCNKQKTWIFQKSLFRVINVIRNIIIEHMYLRNTIGGLFIFFLIHFGSSRPFNADTHTRVCCFGTGKQAVTKVLTKVGANMLNRFRLLLKVFIIIIIIDLCVRQVQEYFLAALLT